MPQQGRSGLFCEVGSRQDEKKKKAQKPTRQAGFAAPLRLQIVIRRNLALPDLVSALGMAAHTLCIALLIGLSAIGQQPTTSPDDVNSHPSQATRDEGKSSSQLQIAEKLSASRPDLDLTAGPDGRLSQDQMQQLFRVVADKDIENDKRQRDYTYIERQVQHNLDSKGRIKSTEVKTYEVLEIYGEQVERLIEKNDKALNAKEASKEDEKIQKIIEKHKNESEADRRKREEKALKEREDNRKFVREIADAFDFKLVGTEPVAGRPAWIIDAEPHLGYQPHTKDGKFLPKFHGRVWIDTSDLQLAKMDVECLDTASWGLFLARFHKGSRFVLEQTRVNDEVWLPRQLAVKVDVRLALLKDVNVDIEQTFRDYKKFRSSSKIVSVGEVQEPK